MRARTRARSCMAKCGVAGPTSSSTSAIVGSTRASGEGSGEGIGWSCVGSVIGATLAGSILARVRRRLPADVLLLFTVLFWTFPLGRGGSPGGERGHLPLMLGAAAVGIWLNQVTFTYSVRLTTAATVALMFGTLPIFVALAAQAFGIERLRPRHWLATVLSFSGVALVALGSSGGLEGDLGGILLGLGASVTWALYSVAMGPLMQRYSPYRISAFMLLAGSVPLLLSALRQLGNQDWHALGGLAWAAFVYSLFFSLVFTNIMWFTAIDRVGAARASLYANLQPFLGAFFALVVLSEEMGALQFAGGFVIGAGILVARLARPPAPSVD